MTKVKGKLINVLVSQALQAIRRKHDGVVVASWIDPVGDSLVARKRVDRLRTTVLPVTDSPCLDESAVELLLSVDTMVSELPQRHGVIDVDWTEEDGWYVTAQICDWNPELVYDSRVATGQISLDDIEDSFGDYARLFAELKAG